MEEEIDLRQYYRVVVRQWRVIVAAMLLAVALQVGLAVYAARSAPTYEAYFWIRAAVGTEDLFNNVDGLILLVTDRSFQRAAFAAAGLNSDVENLKLRVTATPVRALSVLRVGVFGGLDPGRLRMYEGAIAAELVRQGGKSADDRKGAMLAALDGVTAAALKLSASNTTAIGQALPGSPGVSGESLIARALTLGTITSATQGLYTNLFQTEKDITLRLLDIRPPQVLILGGTSLRSPVAVGRITSAMLLGLVAGIMLAFLADRRRSHLGAAPVRETRAAVAATDGHGGA